MNQQLNEWLALQCQMLAGARAAIAFIGASERAPGARVAQWPRAGCVTPRLSSTAELARSSGTAAIQEGSGRPGSVAHFALPILCDDRAVGAVGIEVEGLSPPQIKAALEQLGRGLRGLSMLVAAHRDLERLDGVVGFAGSLLEHESLPEAAHALAGDLSRALGCERVAVGLLDDKRVRVVGLSTSLQFSAESDAIGDLRDAIEEAIDQDALIELPAPAGAPVHATLAHARLADRSGARTVCTLPLAWREQTMGALVCEWSRENALDETRRSALNDTGVLCGPLLGLLARADEGPIARARSGLARFSERRFGENRRVVRVALLGAALLLVGLAAAPADYRVSSRARLEGRVQRALVASVDGYLAETEARAGDLVAAGDVLARLDDRDLELERRKQQSETAQLENEYREALAGQDRTRISIVRSQIEKAKAQLRLAEERLGRTHVTAPFDGIVVEGNLDQSLGSPVRRGDVLFKLAPLDGYRIIVEVDDRDIADVAPGQTGRLALSALPGQSLPLLVERVTPIATQKDGRNFFRVEASLEQHSDVLRPGMEGIAKVEVGRRRLLWIWTHELLDWLRLRAWSYLP